MSPRPWFTSRSEKREDQQVAEELRKAGLHISSVYDLVNVTKSYPKAIPILLQLLPTIKEAAIKEGIVRALTVKEARPMAACILLKEFQQIPPAASGHAQILKWVIGNALSVVANDDVFDDLVRLVYDKRYGKAREMLAVALGNMRNPKAVKVLLDLLEDEEVAGHAIMALGKLKAQTARSAIKPFLHHSKAWIRREAKRALTKIGSSGDTRLEFRGHTT